MGMTPYVVFIIGETTCWDHMGIFTSVRTRRSWRIEKIWRFRAVSCDTATKLSLRCMFVWEGGRIITRSVPFKKSRMLAVLKQPLDSSSDLYAMQSEMWFYSNTMADNISLPRAIGAEPRNRGKTVDDAVD